jgi:hypothetical protein
MVEELDVSRNRQLCLHPQYKYRRVPVPFDDTNLRDEWQDKVYKSAWELALRGNFKRILDFGCGSGYKLIKYFSPFDTIGFEVPPALNYLRKKYPQRHWEDSSDLASVSFRGDILICSDVLEHMIDPIVLLEKLASSAARYMLLSTPALDLLSDRGWSPRLGPPQNESHVNEWTTEEFRRLVIQYLDIVDHTVVNVEQCTQLIVAVPK